MLIAHSCVHERGNIRPDRRARNAARRGSTLSNIIVHRGWLHFVITAFGYVEVFGVW